LTLLIGATAIALIVTADPMVVTTMDGYANYVEDYYGNTLIHAHYELAGRHFLSDKPVRIISNGVVHEYEVVKYGVWDGVSDEFFDWHVAGTITLRTCYPTFGTVTPRWMVMLREVNDAIDRPYSEYIQ